MSVTELDISIVLVLREKSPIATDLADRYRAKTVEILYDLALKDLLFTCIRFALKGPNPAYIGHGRF